MVGQLGRWVGVSIGLLALNQQWVGHCKRKTREQNSIQGETEESKKQALLIGGRFPVGHFA